MLAYKELLCRVVSLTYVSFTYVTLADRRSNNDAWRTCSNVNNVIIMIRAPRTPRSTNDWGADKTAKCLIVDESRESTNQGILTLLATKQAPGSTSHFFQYYLLGLLLFVVNEFDSPWWRDSLLREHSSDFRWISCDYYCRSKPGIRNRFASEMMIAQKGDSRKNNTRIPWQHR